MLERLIYSAGLNKATGFLVSYEQMLRPIIEKFCEFISRHFSDILSFRVLSKYRLVNLKSIDNLHTHYI